MKLETPLIALMISSLFFTGLFLVFFNVADEYEVSYDLEVFNTQGNETNIYDAFNRINKTKADIDEVNQDIDTTLLTNSGSLFPFFSLTLKIGKNIYHSLTIFKDVFNITAELLGIPSQFVIAFFSILTFLFTLSILWILLGRSVVN